ncbi:formylmethanofuran dehydrogenase subunit E [Desulfomicrobium macestii]|uniref:Formylmethanofuran dehydrogenase subunit E n=2 Tax=Desulfomicrobium macestii TaxID=90731 RepID=A0ABR9H7G2_9BACT|nr:formylmethanofuran dehydrogenase subunit E [Desulfomicrobium macestii]
MNMPDGSSALSYASPVIGPYTVDEFIEAAGRFHGYAAPGLILGGFMVHEAKSHIAEGILFDAISETAWCLPDAVQMLTPCTVGNGWLRIFHLGLYAVSLFDKFTGKGVRVAVETDLLTPYPTIREWLFKLKPKKEQDSKRLREEIRMAGASICSVKEIALRPEFMGGRGKGAIAACPSCGQAYPARDGSVCRSCRGESPYMGWIGGYDLRELGFDGPRLRVVAAEEAVGEKTLHDMTCIDPGVSKDAAFTRGQVLDVGDVCRLQRMGRFEVYVEDEELEESRWVHEDDAARLLAAAVAGDGVDCSGEPREGKITMVARHGGLVTINEEALEELNAIPGVMCATRHAFSVVEKGQQIAATRAIPLYLGRDTLGEALRTLGGGPAVSVRPFGKRQVGILVTGTEVFKGLVEDRFIPIITAKVEAYGCPVVATDIVPDERKLICRGVQDMLDRGVELIVTTAGLSVDPGDVTRQGLVDAGLENLRYGTPILPGAMTLLGSIEGVELIGVPACALYFKTTSLDLLLPRVLAGMSPSRRELARLGHGGLCMQCKRCTYPKCPFGK